MGDSELTRLEKVAALIAVATVTMGVAGDQLATLLEDGEDDLLPVLDAIRNSIDVMGNVAKQAAQLCQTRKERYRRDVNL